MSVCIDELAECIPAAAALAAIVALPNLSMSVAYAWEKLPVVGTVVKVFVWRDYQFAEENYEADVRTPTVQVERGADVDPAVSGALEQSADAVNASAKELTDEVLAAFQEEMEADENLEGVGKVQADYEILTDTDRYFSMRVWSLETGADSYEQNRYYTIDRSTGKLLTLADLFSGTDYVQDLSREIREEMARQMEADENVVYWLDDEDIPEGNFQEIAADQSFYIDSQGELVICFGQGEVAPMYMGSVTFTMPETVWK
jgi:hypothetical protein